MAYHSLMAVVDFELSVSR